MLRVLNLGAGVQSSTVLLMACQGELPKPDVALFADTGEEPASVYNWLRDVLTPAATAAGITIETVRAHSAASQSRPTKLGDIPAFVAGSDGKGAPVRRQCTRDWKIDPLDRRVKELLGLARGQRWPKDVVVESWLGISGDEIQRMKSAVEPWRRYWHPLIEDPWKDDKAPRWRNPPLRRNDCQKWLVANGYGEAPRSACTFCPFHGDAEWRRMQTQEPEAFAAAVAADAMIRTNPTRHRWRLLYVHRSLQPLGEIDFTKQQELTDLFSEECGGVCGV